jgi:hypothetical protein
VTPADGICAVKLGIGPANVTPDDAEAGLAAAGVLVGGAG